MTTKTSGWRYKGAVLARAMAASVGGYGLAAAFAVFMARVLPLDKAEAVLAGAVPSFLVYCAAVIWVFAARSAWRAWIGILIPTGLLTVVAYAIGQGAPL